MVWEEAVQNPFFLSCLEIMSMCVVGTILDSDGAFWIMDEEVGPNLVAVAGCSRSGNHRQFIYLGVNSWRQQ